MTIENNNTNSPFKVVSLAHGKRTVIPSSVKLLNPEAEGKKQVLYFVWPLSTEDPEHPCSLQEAIDGEGFGLVFGFFTNHYDLYKLGRHDEAMFRFHFNAVKVDYLCMLDKLCKALAVQLDDGVSCGFAWCLCDASGKDVPVGTSAFAITNEKAAKND